ncbi:MAG: hypothetical protein LBT38_07450 [Deltaproteobacteria bacterium]|jgi:Na+-translocating ferredoxin:NAD+ oxidoreductase RnfC subunit|nr:hypothetical protein [Deltaproteobacteria bacterium]
MGAPILKPWPEEPEELSLPLAGRSPLKGLKVGRLISQGQLLAPKTKTGQGALRAPLAGTLKSISPLALIITPGPATPMALEPVDITQLYGAQLAEALSDLGLNCPEPPSPKTTIPETTILVSALESEPSLTLSQALWSERPQIMSQGLAMVSRLYPENPRLLARPRALKAPLDWPSVVVEKPYPWTFGPFLKKSLNLGYERLIKGYLTSRDIYLMGLVERQGLPPRHWPLAIQRQNYLVPLGLTPKAIFKAISLEPGSGDVAVFGGARRGRPWPRLDLGLDLTLANEVMALDLVRAKNQEPPLGPCRACGSCRAACPLDLPMDELGRQPLAAWPQLGLLTQKLLALCPDCGQCALACPARRPLRYFSSWL